MRIATCNENNSRFGILSSDAYMYCIEPPGTTQAAPPASCRFSVRGYEDHSMKELTLCNNSIEAPFSLLPLISMGCGASSAAPSNKYEAAEKPLLEPAQL